MRGFSHARISQCISSFFARPYICVGSGRWNNISELNRAYKQMLIGNLQSRGINGTETEVFGATAVAIAYFMRYTSRRAWPHTLTRLSVRRCSHVNSDLPLVVGLKLTLPLGNSHLSFHRAGGDWTLCVLRHAD